ncbi:cytochrome c oxidase assembly factor CtaG [Kitasatospora sp. MAP12-15]|uniref:cytochrome c oxidase assembly protein n=1 Tax=unclassified Kitasatospora TaxID=2633591 RepID=UPI002474A4B8|nr:cytochrome c oxidase assembly protein [Kitasatospora sp. MAP12-44]MDH6113247.1 cytochrome c oxidase assembly factor CtaG [Kitasatospora sp. MAP12-44]
MQTSVLAAEALATGYHGPPPWQWADLATSWTAEPVVLALAVLLGGGYLLGVRTLARAGERWLPTRTAAFLGGLLLWIWVTCSGLGVYERILFTDRAVQVVLLLMVVPLLLALGAPVSLLVQTAPPARRERILRALRSGPSKLLMFPAVSTALLMAPPWLLYFTPWYEKTLTSGLWNIGLHLSLVALGLAYFWPRLQIDPVGHEYPHLLGLFITFAEVIFDAGLGIVLIYGGHLVGGHYYAELARPWGPSIAQDQTWGGNALWVLGDLVGLPFIWALVRRMIAQGKEETAAVDAELDARFEAAAEAAAVGGAAPEDEQGMRPWWLDDPNLRHRYGAES